MDGPEVNILSEVSQAEKDKDHDITYTWNLKKEIQMNLFIKQNRFTDIENRFMVAKRRASGRGMEWKFGLADAN